MEITLNKASSQCLSYKMSFLVRIPPTMAATSQFKSKSDVLYRRLILSNFFTKGWGEIDAFKRLFECRDTFHSPSEARELVPPSYPVIIDRTWKKDSYHIAEGHFLSPVAKHIPGLLPKESEKARFQVITPTKWREKDKRPICIQLAGTGDHFFWRRRNFMAKPLIHEHCIASIILENPYYGLRKPADQIRSSLKYVIDLFIMGASLILESSVLLHWCERQGYGPLGITGISMGGNMASLAATIWPKPLAVIPCLSWSTASCVFTQGVMKNSLPWKKLEKQLEDEEYRNQIIKYANLVDDVKEHNLFSKSMDDQSQSYHFQKSGTNLSSTKDQHMNLFKNNQEHDMNQSQTLSLENYHIFHSVKDAILDYVPPPLKTRKHVIKTPKINPETVTFMNILMDKATHLKNYPHPYEPRLAKFVAAKRDAYVPIECVAEPVTIWRGSEVEYLDAGHIGASVTNLGLFRKLIKEKLDEVPQYLD